MTAGTARFEHLQVIRDGVPHAGALNMALDEVLLQNPGDTPLLRFYRWAQPTVTFGYFEPSGAARRVAKGREIIRRLTGGGIVEHGDDVTFTLIIPRGVPFARLRSVESYRQIHAALARALECGGVAVQAQEDEPSPPADSSQPNSCFERPVLHDLITSGTKVAGGAQRRTRFGLLHQGSIRPDPVRAALWRENLGREFPLALARFCEERNLAPDEIMRAELLASAKYATPAWTDRV